MSQRHGANPTTRNSCRAECEQCLAALVVGPGLTALKNNGENWKLTDKADQGKAGEGSSMCGVALLRQFNKFPT